MVLSLCLFPSESHSLWLSSFYSWVWNFCLWVWGWFFLSSFFFSLFSFVLLSHSAQPSYPTFYICLHFIPWPEPNFMVALDYSCPTVLLEMLWIQLQSQQVTSYRSHLCGSVFSCVSEPAFCQQQKSGPCNYWKYTSFFISILFCFVLQMEAPNLISGVK